MGLNFLNKLCKVHRSSMATSNKSYVDKTTTYIGEYPCRLSRQSSTVVSGQPQSTMMSYMRMYMDMGADIKEGDRADVDGKRYRVSFIYAPNDHHLEVDLQLQGQGVEF